MNSTVVLTGALPAVIIVSAVLTTMVSVFLLWLYRLAVVPYDERAGERCCGTTESSSGNKIMKMVISDFWE